jgi:hypothetical protein
MQFYASKMVGQFASDKLGQFRWILQFYWLNRSFRVPTGSLC